MPVQKNIRYCRKQNNLSQTDFASILGVSQSTVHSWESKRTFPGMKEIKKAAEYFRVDLREFCDIDLEKRDFELTNGSPLTIDEIQSVLKFRTIPEPAKLAIRAAINASYEEANNIWDDSAIPPESS